MGAKGKSKYDGKILVGQRFSKWTVVSSKILLEGEAKILCKCDCGTERYVSVFSLMVGTSNACTICSHVKFGTANKTWRGYEELPSKFIGKLKNKDEKVELLALWRKQDGKCAISGWGISFTERTASLDRIDSTKGYVIGNVHWVHVNVNVCKNGFSLPYFLTLCHAVANHNADPDEHSSEWLFGSKMIAHEETKN